MGLSSSGQRKLFLKQYNGISEIINFLLYTKLAIPKEEHLQFFKQARIACTLGYIFLPFIGCCYEWPTHFYRQIHKCQNGQDNEGANLGKATVYTLIDLTAPPNLVRY